MILFAFSGLSRLVAASFTEDVFGVVQKVQNIFNAIKIFIYNYVFLIYLFLTCALVSDVAIYIDVATGTSSGSIHL